MAKTAGIDIGSRTTKLVVVENGRIADSQIAPTSHDPLSVALQMTADLTDTVVVATGYGRHLFKSRNSCTVISEIKAVSLGARWLFPECGAILDIGGQDTKAVVLNPNGSVAKFEMNDKCAAGTGRFLEMSAMALSFSDNEFAAAAQCSATAQSVSSMCTVFAESEIVSLVARGALRDAIALGIHESVVKRAASMLGRVSARGPVMFAGGVAKNATMCRLLEQTLKTRLLVPQAPQIVSALGAAVFGAATPMTETQSR